MTLRGLLLWGTFGAVAVAALAGFLGADTTVTTLETSLGAEVRTSRL